ncbi:cystin-1 isoform X1 [Cynocephalus volans]|uniref:cystin-1 isoform X1 n=1 Tax=Cynocephalus volans TaxID=110931 RepID=UPI002FC923DE
MGSGSSRSGRSGRALRRRRSSDSRPAEPGGAAPQVGTRPRLSATAAEEATGHDPGPAAPPDGGDETLRLLDQLLAESAAWDPGEPAPRRPARPRPAAGAGSAVLPEQSTEDHPESSSASRVPPTGSVASYQERTERGDSASRPLRAPGQLSVPAGFVYEQALSEAPGSSHKRPERQSAISYDYSEEELMASIEREYCR